MMEEASPADAEPWRSCINVVDGLLSGSKAGSARLRGLACGRSKQDRTWHLNSDKRTSKTDEVHGREAGETTEKHFSAFRFLSSVRHGTRSRA